MQKRSVPSSDGKVLCEEQLTAIVAAIESLKYGVVSIIVQDGKVVQIEKMKSSECS